MVDNKKKLARFQENARDVSESLYSREAGVIKFVFLFKHIGWIEAEFPKRVQV